jgi:YVTN family beta-propeller protein
MRRVVQFLCLFFLYVFSGLMYAETGSEAWVVNNADANVSTIDILSSTPILPAVSVGEAPFFVAITPDDKYVLVTNTDDGSVSVIDVASRTQVGSPISVGGGTAPMGIAITPDGRYAWVCIGNSDTVSIIDISAHSVVGTITGVGLNPSVIAITPDGNYAWVACYGSNNVFILDVATQSVDGSMTVLTRPTLIAITPDNKYALVTDQLGSDVGVVDLATRSVVQSVPVGNAPGSVAITSNNTYAAVGNLSDNTVSIIDLATLSVVGSPISVGGSPSSIAITSDSKYAWVCLYGLSEVVVIDLSTHLLVGSPVSVGRHPYSIAISPDQAPTASFSVTMNGMAATFDASASSSPVGTIATYQWDFGDGSAVETVTSSSVSHTYSNNGTFTVTLVVTNSQGTSLTQTFTGQTVSNNGGSTAEIQKQISTEVPAPRKFKGKAKIHRDSKKVFLRTTWKKGLSAHVKKYEIFAHAHKISTISAKHHHLKKTVRLHPQHFPHKHLSRDYRKYLEEKYSIRAVDSQGHKSLKTSLHMSKRIAKEIFMK